MVKRLCAIIFVLLAVSLLSAQSGNEIIELNTAALADSAWQNLYQELAAYTHPIRLDVRISFGNSARYSILTGIYHLQQESVLVNFRHDWLTGVNSLNFRLGIDTGNFKTALGAYRFRFGNGLLSSAASRAPADSLWQICDPASPLSYTPLGIAATYRYNWLNAAVLASYQNREAHISDDLITSLPSTRTGELGIVRESVFGAGFGFSSDYFCVGALVCRQDYDKPFADASLAQRLWTASLASTLDFTTQKLDAEAAWINGHPAVSAIWRMQVKGFSHALSYALNGVPKQVAFAHASALLDNALGRSELGYHFRLSLPLHLDLEARYNLNYGSSFSGGLLSRFIASLKYQNKGNSLALSYADFDKEVITLVDSTYTSDMPRNYRLRLAGKYYFKKGFYQQLDCAFSLRDRNTFSQNTFRALLAIGADIRKLHLKAGFQSWQSPRTFLIEDELSPEYYSLCTEDDSEVFLLAEQRFKFWSFSVQARKSVLHTQDYNLYAKLSVAPF
jgi:hypothetical protein